MVDTAASIVKLTCAVTEPQALVAVSVNVVLVETVPKISPVGDDVTDTDVEPFEIDNDV